MKKLVLVMLLLTGIAFSTQSAQAQTNNQKNFIVSFQVPLATTINITATEIDSATGVFGSQVTALDFSPVVLDTNLGIFLPDHFFAIDVGASGGAGTPSTTVTYVEGNNPNSPGKGLGWKSTMTFVKVTTTETVLSAGKKLLKDLSGLTISSADVAGGFLRMYVGVVTGDPSANPPDPAEAEVYSLSDAPGTYDGTLTISATIT